MSERALPATLTMTYEKKVTEYNNSAEKKVDDALEKLLSIKVASSGNLREYADRLEAHYDYCASLDLDFTSNQKEAIFRRGLPYRLRLEAAAIQASALFIMDPSTPGLVEDLESIQRDIKLRSARKRKPEDEAENPPASPSSSRKRKTTAAAATETTDGVSVTPAASKKRKGPNPNKPDIPARENTRALARATQGTSTPVKDESIPDSKLTSLYYLGHPMLAHIAFAYLLNFATDVERPGPLAMGVALFPKTALMIKILKDTTRSYGRSRSNQLLTIVARVADDNFETVGADAVDVVAIDSNLLQEPTSITRTGSFEESVNNLAKLWKQNASTAVRQRMVESWANNVLYSSVGLQGGDKVERRDMTKLKNSVIKLLTVIRPAKFQGEKDQSLLRVQYYWKLLAAFRVQGAPFIVAYRPSTVDSILALDGAARLKPEDLPSWIPIINTVEQHISSWFDALEGGNKRPELKALYDEIRVPCQWYAPWEQYLWNFHCDYPSTGFRVLKPITPLGMAIYGYGSFIHRRKCWGVMDLPNTQQSIAVTQIPEASYLGVVPGILRCSGFHEEGSIIGSAGLWLDTRDSKGSLAHISLGTAEEANTVVVWFYAGDPKAPMWKTCYLLAFSCRPITMFEPLVRWDQGVVLKQESS